MNQPIIRPDQILRTLLDHPRRWILPAAVIAALALGYALVRPSKWEASQTLVVRDETVGEHQRQGQFSDSQRMKTAQETVAELARSRAVVAEALRRVGPPSGRAAEGWPSLEDIEKVQGHIDIKAPKGAEFGTTEVFYLIVTTGSRQRAAELTEAICDMTEKRLGELRDRRAESLIAELQHTAEVVRNDLDAATARLAGMERELGADLAELRILNEAGSGESNLRSTLVDVSTELRQANAARQTSEHLLTLLEAATQDPLQLVATPNQLLESQPALRRLKDGLIDAQLRTASLLGTMAQDHPMVRAARISEQEIRQHLHHELAIAIRGLQVELNVGADRLASLTEQRDNVQQRLARLANVRAEYGNLVVEVRNRTEILTDAERNLSDARVSRAAAHSSSLITRLDGPVVGTWPVGPRRSLIVLAGLIGGLATGLGVVVLTVAPNPTAKPVAADAPAPAVIPTKPSVVELPTVGLSLKDALTRLTGKMAWN